VQAHLHVVAVLLPAGHLAADEGARLVHVHLIPLRGPSARAELPEGVALVRERRAALKDLTTRPSCTDCEGLRGRGRASCGDRPCMRCSQLGMCALQREAHAQRARGRWAARTWSSSSTAADSPARPLPTMATFRRGAPCAHPELPVAPARAKLSPITSSNVQCARSSEVGVCS